MSIISDAIQAKCLAFGDRVIKLNDYLLKEAANAKPAYKIVKGKRVYEKSVFPKELEEETGINDKGFLREKIDSLVKSGKLEAIGTPARRK